MDFTGDGRSDWATIATNGTVHRWKVTGNPAPAGPNQAFQRAFDYGFTSDLVYPDDYIGDRKTDVTVWRPGTPGIFFVAEFPIGTGGIILNRAVLWGQTGDNDISPNLTNENPIGDYDGDGKADYTVVRVNQANGNLTWWIMSSATGAQRAIPFGTLSGFPKDSVAAVLGADFNNDGKDELVLATLDNANQTFYYLRSSNNNTVVDGQKHGDPGDVPLASLATASVL